MLFTKWESLSFVLDVEQVKKDCKSAKRIGQYKFGNLAIYRPDGKYLPYTAITEGKHDRTSVHVSGCCAGGVWVERLLLCSDTGKYAYLFDRDGEIEKAKEYCAQHGITVEKV